MRRLWLIPLFIVSAVPASIVASDGNWTCGPYQYDGAGNIKAIGPSDTFTYDAFGRITYGTAGPGHSQSFEYDRFGNLEAITTDQVRLTLGVNAQTNRLTDSTKGVYGDYDAAGRMTRMTSVDSSGGFTYDALNMSKESTVDGVRKIHLYTASNERVASITMVAGAESRSDWTPRDQANRVLRRLERSGGTWRWTQDYIYGDGQLLAAEVASSSGTLHFHRDHLGTPRLITGNGGVEVSRHTYYPFGREIEETRSQDAERLKFTGHERDITSSPARDLDYMHARYYTPMWGRFLSVDPGKDWDPAKPQSWNMYAYVRNNPINKTDPTGRCTPPCINFDFAYGVVSAFGSNLVLGYGRPEPTSGDMATGQVVGDVLSIAAGAQEVVSGATMATTGGAITVGSRGSTAVVTVPAAVVGTVAVVHGTTVVATASANLGRTAGAEMSRTTPQRGRDRPRPNEQYNNPPAQQPRPGSPNDPKQPPTTPPLVPKPKAKGWFELIEDILDKIF